MPEELRERDGTDSLGNAREQSPSRRSKKAHDHGDARGETSMPS